MTDADESEKPMFKLAALVIAGVLAGTGGSLGFRVVDNPRPDPFTGTQAQQLKMELERKIDKLEERLRSHDKESEKWKLKIQSNKDRMDYHLRNHP